MQSRLCRLIAATLLAALPLTRSASAQHAGDIWVGVSAAGQLKHAGLDLNAVVVVLPPSSGALVGWADNDPGFDRVTLDDPNHDLFQMSPGAMIWAEVVQLDPAFRMIDASFNVYDAPGERMLLGNNNLHVHAIWHINSQDPVFDPLRTHWRATLKLVDTGTTGYTDSADFTVRFGNVACQGGDVDGDTLLTLADVDAFFEVLDDPAGHTDVQRCAADADLDGRVTAADLEPLLALLGTCLGDISVNQSIDLTDLSVLLTNFGVGGSPSYQQGNLNGDEVIDLTDLSTLLTRFGQICS